MLPPELPPGDAISVREVSKSYGETRAVSSLSFDVNRGEVFALLGPNGAGKTTTIRMVMGLIEPSAGQVRVLGEAVTPQLRKRIGYLPEERGLYRDVAVLDGIVYLATLKGVERSVARRRAVDGLDRLDLGHVAGKPLRALSRGMAQKVQFLATVLHQPDLLVIDEPFSGLDPVNARVLRDMLVELSASGTTVVLSAHQMHQVEELCRRVLVLVKGRPVLYGSLEEIRELFGSDTVLVQAHGDLRSLPGVLNVTDHGRLKELELAPGTKPEDVLAALAARPDMGVTHFEVHAPSLEEIFLIVAAREARTAGSGAAGLADLKPIAGGGSDSAPPGSDSAPPWSDSAPPGSDSAPPGSDSAPRP